MSHFSKARKRERSPARAEEAHQPPTTRRNVVVVTSASDRAQLEKHFTFVPKNSSSTWQERMVEKYHQNLYKEYVIGDFSRAAEGKIGLRWRTQAEVESGRGQRTCGNKHCPSSRVGTSTNDDMMDPQDLQEYLRRAPLTEEDERKRLESVNHGAGLCDYEVPFSYVEHGEAKQELVKVKLCLRCAPLLYATKSDPSLQAFRARATDNESHQPKDKESDEEDPSSDSSSEPSRRHRKRRKKRRSKDRKKNKRSKPK